MESEILQQLRGVRAKWEVASGVIADYQVALQRSLDLEVRVAQLKKENEELRDEGLDKDNTISALTHKAKKSLKLESEKCDQVEHAHEDLKKELEEVKAEMKNCNERNAQFETELKSVRGDLETAEERVKVLEDEKLGLECEVEEAKTATSLAISEMQASKTQTEEALVKLRQLDQENFVLTDKIKRDQESLMEKWQEVTEMEEMVQRSKAEVERVRSQLTMEREMNQDSTITAFWKRKQNPFAKRLAAYARLVEKGEIGKVTQGLDQLLMEMKDQRHRGRTRSLSVRGSTEDGFYVLSEEEEETALPSTQIMIPAEGNEMQRGHHGSCTSCSASAMGNLVATGGTDRQIMLWDPATMTVQSVLKGMVESVRDVSFTCNGEAVLGAGADKCVRVWKTGSGVSLHTLTGHSRGVNCVACDPADPHKAVSSGEDRHLRFWDLIRGFQIQNREIKLEEWTNAVCYASTGNLIASGHSRGGIKLWDVRSSEKYAEMDPVHHDAIVALCALPLSTNLLLSAGKDNKLCLFDFRTQHVVHIYHDPQFCIGMMSYMGKGKSCISVSRDEQLIAAGSTSGCVMIWNADGSNHDRPKKLKPPSLTEPIIATAWANETLFSCDRGGNVVIWT